MRFLLHILNAKGSRGPGVSEKALSGSTALILGKKVLLTFTGFSRGPSVIHLGRAYLPFPGQVLLEMSEPANEVSKGLPLWGERTLAGRGARGRVRDYTHRVAHYIKVKIVRSMRGSEGREGKRFVPPLVVFAILNWMLGAGIGHSHSYLNNLPRTATTL